MFELWRHKPKGNYCHPFPPGGTRLFECNTKIPLRFLLTTLALAASRIFGCINEISIFPWLLLRLTRSAGKIKMANVHGMFASADTLFTVLLALFLESRRRKTGNVIRDYSTVVIRISRFLDLLGRRLESYIFD